jgi:lipopolysaccharide/colanic/teichoic acid biosynthesis glycosyltransferase
MQTGADKLKNTYKKYNEADGPVFKIHNDPRYTRIGKFLSHTGLDELPQLFNIIKGEMAFVGPRPLPLDEAQKVPEKYTSRFSVLPGITSLWVIKGSHKLSFKEWMELDVAYVSKKNTHLDIEIGFRTAIMIMSQIFKQLVRSS